MPIKNKKGFTIVELLIVIVVIGILAAITIVAFNGVQTRARDARSSDAAVKVAKAIQIWSIDRGLPLTGGSGSATTVSNGMCADGANGWAASGIYVCSIEDMLVSSGLMPANFITSLPPNKYYGAATNGRLSMMFYRCGAVNASTWALYWYIEDPSTQDTSNINSVVASCSQATIRDTYGMRGAKLLTF